jgi:hypothetical protein
VEALQLPAMRQSLDQDGREDRVEVLRDGFFIAAPERRTRDIGIRKKKATALGKIFVCW